MVYITRGFGYIPPGALSGPSWARPGAILKAPWGFYPGPPEAPDGPQDGLERVPGMPQGRIYVEASAISPPGAFEEGKFQSR